MSDEGKGMRLNGIRGRLERMSDEREWEKERC